MRTESLCARPTGTEAEFLNGFCPDFLVVQIAPIYYYKKQKHLEHILADLSRMLLETQSMNSLGCTMFICFWGCMKSLAGNADIDPLITRYKGEKKRTDVGHSVYFEGLDAPVLEAGRGHI